MVEIQADEYGGGSAQRMHSELFAGLMRDLDLDATYGALWDEAPAAAFASVNTMSLFGLHRRWRGAALGHLAARRDDLVRAQPPLLRRACAGSASTSGRRSSTTSTSRPTPSTSRSPRSTCAARWSPRSPALLPDVLFGAACSLAMDGVAAHHLLGAWEAGAPRCTGAGRWPPEPPDSAQAVGDIVRRSAVQAAVLHIRAHRRRPAPRRPMPTGGSGLFAAVRAQDLGAGRGRLGALGAENPDRLCVPSQKGLMPDFPHRHSAMVVAARDRSRRRPGRRSRKSPRTISGPSR